MQNKDSVHLLALFPVKEEFIFEMCKSWASSRGRETLTYQSVGSLCKRIMGEHFVERCFQNSLEMENSKRVNGQKNIACLHGFYTKKGDKSGSGVGLMMIGEQHVNQFDISENFICIWYRKLHLY